MRGLKGKVAVVAGGGGGIGAATSLRLGSEGARVVVGDIDLENARLVAEQIVQAGGEAISLPFDMADEQSIAELIRSSAERMGCIDLLHVNAVDPAAIAKDGDALSVPLEIFREILNVGLHGYLACTRYAATEMLKRGGGAIVYTSSDPRYRSDPQHVSYRVAKAGVNTLMYQVASTYGRQGIRANAVLPGFIVTPGTIIGIPQAAMDELTARTPSTRHGAPDDIASAVAFLMSDEAGFINGQTLIVDGGLGV